MNIPNLKDRILKLLFANSPNEISSHEIAKKLNIEHYTAYALCVEIEKDGYIKIIETTSINSPEKECIAYITEIGKHFSSINSYRKIDREKWMENIPKKYWYFASIFAVITFALPLYLQQCKPHSQETTPKEPSKQTQVSYATDSTHK